VRFDFFGPEWHLLNKLNGVGGVLGLRLDDAMEQRLGRFARESRRSKSDIARDAVREYLDRHAVDDEYKRQVRAIAAATTEAELARIDALSDDLMAGEPDYDWSDPAQ
jgi:RHH-type transcriptional regulator, rel operon repressor / antitoxin RelB